MKKASLTCVGALAIVLAAIACGGDSGKKALPTVVLDPADFQARVTHPFFPLTPGSSRVYEGEELDPETGEKLKIRVESMVLLQTETIAGIEATVLQAKDFEDGDLTEDARDYYAQGKDGAVYHLGERVDDYEDGKVVGHTGQWLLEGANRPGIAMPADPKLGVEFEPDRAPKVAESRAKVVALDQMVLTPAGSFSACIKIEELDPLEDVTVVNFFCKDTGLVRMEPPGTAINLISSTKGP